MTFDAFIIDTIDYLGTLVFAISGVLAAIEKKFDLFGAIILGLVTAIGGGTLRDMMIGNTPVTWLNNPTYLLLSLSALPICYYFRTYIVKWRKSFFLFDTMGIALFTILGMEKTLAFGLNPIIAILMGIITAVFGGVIRDVLSNEVPLIFRKEVYAFACLAGAISYYLAQLFIDTNISMALSICIVFAIRFFAIKKHWELPFAQKRS